MTAPEASRHPDRPADKSFQTQLHFFINIMATIREQQQAHERRELIRSIILRVCHAARVGGNGLGVSLGLIERGLQRDGLHILLEEIEAEVGYLAGKGWIETVRKENTPANRRWRITAAGVDQAEAEGF